MRRTPAARSRPRRGPSVRSMKAGQGLRVGGGAAPGDGLAQEDGRRRRWPGLHAPPSGSARLAHHRLRNTHLPTRKTRSTQAYVHTLAARTSARLRAAHRWTRRMRATWRTPRWRTGSTGSRSTPVRPACRGASVARDLSFLAPGSFGRRWLNSLAAQRWPWSSVGVSRRTATRRPLCTSTVLPPR